MKEIVVVGLGPGSLVHLSMGVWQILSAGDPLYLRTNRHPVVEELAAHDLRFSTFDYLYEEKRDFQEVYESIVEILLSKVKNDPLIERLVYGVPGHPLAGETTVQLLREKAAGDKEVKITIIPGMSFVDVLLNTLQIDLLSGFTVLDALDLSEETLVPSHHQIFTQVYSRLVAADLKITLLEKYPPEHPVTVIKGAGISGEEKVAQVKLCELDHITWYDHLTSVYISPLVLPIPQSGAVNKELCEYPLDPLAKILDKLLSPEGCPWDKEQNHFSLKSCLVEETYEVIEAIDSRDMEKLKEELGDVLLQVVFHTALAKREGRFDLNEVIAGISSKMLRRHPHVFGATTVQGTADVLKNWEEIKKAEKGNNISAGKIMDKINRSLPALLLAEEVQKKANKVGFDWENVEGPLAKIIEEYQELKEAIAKPGKEEMKRNRIEEELGDLLFAVVNTARFVGVSPETALYGTVRKFIQRFNFIEQELVAQERTWGETNLHILDKIWKKAKINGL